MDVRHRILDGTLRLFAEAGYLGTTTRRIAQEAGINEVTLFRHFGSKDAAIRAALAEAATPAATLPLDFTDPAATLTRWGQAMSDELTAKRTLIRRIMGEIVERPELGTVVCEHADCDYGQLTAYIAGMRDAGLTTRPFHPQALSAMLLGSLFTDALWRDVMPTMPPPEVTIPEYVRVLLVAMGAEAPPLAMLPDGVPSAEVRR